MKRWFGFVLTVTLTIGGTLRSAAADEAVKDRFNVGEEIPPFTLKAVNGEDLGESYIAIDRYFGREAKEPKKAILLSFFATYCEPCKKEMPLLAALYESYKAKGLQVVLVSIDKDTDKVDVAKNLAKENGVKFPVLTDRYNIVAKRFFIAKLPNLYIVNPEGKVTMVQVGYSGDVSKQIVDEVRRALGEPTSASIPDLVAKHMGTAGSAVETVAVPGSEDNAAQAATTSASSGSSAATAAQKGAQATTDATAAAGDASKAAGPAGADSADAQKGKGKAKNKGKAKAKGKGKK